MVQGEGETRVISFFLTRFFSLWIPVVTAALGFGLKVYSEDIQNPCPILSKTCISGNKYINIQLRHQMLTKATQWVGFYFRPSFCSVFVHVFHHGVLGSKGDQDLPLLHQRGCEASRAPCTEPRCVHLTESPPETAGKLCRVGYFGEETWQGWFLNTEAEGTWIIYLGSSRLGASQEVGWILLRESVWVLVQFAKGRESSA